MTNRVFTLAQDGTLRRLESRPYSNEDMLQRLLAQFPELLAGDEMGDAPKRWLFVARECGVPGDESGSNRWALDHLFIDHDAIPTLVEVKLGSDNRIRREVVGQMLDYAANAVAYWPVERLRAMFEARCQQSGVDPVATVGELISAGSSEDVERFWTQVKTNLQAGRVRLVFVADDVPPELRRIVEFLNSQMDPAEVLAVEVKQFAADDHSTFVPRVIGQSAMAVQKKAAGGEAAQKWTPERFFSKLESRDAGSASVARDLLEWITPLVSRVWWGEGRQDGSFVPIVDLTGASIGGSFAAHFFVVWTYGSIEMQFQSLKSRPFFQDSSQRLALVERLNLLPGVQLPPDCIDRRPSFPILSLRSPEAMATFKEAIKWAIEQVQTSAAAEG